jgi:hypothetical protein
MSREERRQYQRMMKGVDRSPVPPIDPAARARLERNRARREATRPSSGGAFTARFVLIGLAIALGLGLVAFSLAWPNGMPFALYVGIGVALVAAAGQVAFRLLQRRVSGA